MPMGASCKGKTKRKTSWSSKMQVCVSPTFSHYISVFCKTSISCRCKDSYFESVRDCKTVFSVFSLYTHTVIIYVVQQVFLIYNTKLEKGIYHVMTERKTSWRCKDASFECGDNKAAADDGRCSVACLQKVFSGWIFHPLHNDDAPDSMH